MEVYRTDPRPPHIAADEDAGALDEKAAAAFLGCCPRMLLELRRAGKAPPHFRIGNRVRYPRHRLLEWMDKAVLEGVAVWPRRKPAQPADGGGE